MKFIPIILTIFVSVAFASPVSIIKSSSLIDNLSQSLYIHLNPIFENTFKQLIELVSKLAKQLFENQSRRSNTVQPAEWVSHIFDGTGSLSTQWNSHITDFFGNIPTVYEDDERSLLNTRF